MPSLSFWRSTPQTRHAASTRWERFTRAHSTPNRAQARAGPTKLAASFPHPRSRGFRRRSLWGKCLDHSEWQAPSLRGAPVYPAPGRLLPQRPERPRPREPQRGPARPSRLSSARPGPARARPGVQAAETKEREGAAPPSQPPAPWARTPTTMASPPQPRPVGIAGGRGAWPRRGRRPPPCLPPLPEAKRRADKARRRRRGHPGRPRRPPPNERGREPRKPGALMQ